MLFSVYISLKKVEMENQQPWPDSRSESGNQKKYSSTKLQTRRANLRVYSLVETLLSEKFKSNVPDPSPSSKVSSILAS